MRRLFIVGAKLLGLICIWWAIVISTQIMSVGGLLSFTHMRQLTYSDVISVILFLVGLLAFIALTIWFLTILLLRTEWLADKVGLDKDDELAGWPEEKKLLRLGLLLLGFYVLAYAIPDTVKSSLTLLGEYFIMRPSRFRGASSFLLHYVIPILVNLVGVSIGFLLVLMPTRIIGWVENKQKKYEYKLSKASD
jgi:hypothetical protein